MDLRKQPIKGRPKVHPLVVGDVDPLGDWGMENLIGGFPQEGIQTFHGFLERLVAYLADYPGEGALTED